MDNVAMTRLYSRVDKLETSNRLRGGHDYPQVLGYWALDASAFDGLGGMTTTVTGVGQVLYHCVMPMQNPKLAVRFYLKTTAGTAAYNVTETQTGAIIVAGSTTATAYTIVEKHIDISAIFVYGQFAQYQLTVNAAAGQTSSCRAEYIGGSWTPDAAVAF